MTQITADPKVRQLINNLTSNLVKIMHQGVLETIDHALTFKPTVAPRPQKRRRLVLPAAATPKALPPVSADVTGRVTAFLVGRKDPIDIHELSEKTEIKEPVLRVALQHLVNDGSVTKKTGGQTGRKILYATA